MRGQKHSVSTIIRHPCQLFVNNISIQPTGIHSKSWFPETAENLEFSAERLSVNAKTVNSSMCVRNKGQEASLKILL